MGWFQRFFRTRGEKQKLNADIDRELEFHVDELTRNNISSGMSPDEARRQALIAFGGSRQTAEECRRMRAVSWFDDLRQDLYFAWKMLVKSPGYTIGAILALSLGIGPNAALFTMFDAMALRPLPVPLAERVVELAKATPKIPIPTSAFTFPEYQYFSDHATKFAAISTYLPSHLLMSTPGNSAEAVFGMYVSASYLSVMQVGPVFGTGFTNADDVQAAPPYAAMLSENFWERRFGRDPSIVGKTVLFNGIPSVIVGLTPRDFTGPRPEVPDVLISLAAREDPRRRLLDESPCCLLHGRLKSDVSLPEAQSELNQLTAALYAGRATAADSWTISVAPARAGFQIKGGINPLIIAFTLLQAMIGLVLLIACANVAGLLLGKALSRRKEIAVRLALGAGRARLVRQLLTEALLIAQLAGALSLVMTWCALKFLVGASLRAISEAGISPGGTYLINVTPDLRIVAYGLIISTLTAIGFALVPALQTTRPNLTGVLNEDVPSIGIPGRRGFHGWTVTAQVAACFMLLIAAGTLVGNSRLLLTTDPGFSSDHLLSIAIVDPSQLGYEASRIRSVTQQVESRVSSLPGVVSVASASRIPLGGLVSRATVAPADDGTSSVLQQIRAERYPLTFISTGYFETLGIGMLQGRAFTAQEISNHAPVAVISSALAARLWPGETALGKIITVGSAPQPSAIPAQPFFPFVTVVGVVRDVYSDTMMAADPGAVYLPSPNGGLERILFIRTAKDPQSLIPLLSNELQAIDRNLAATFQTMGTVVDHDVAYIVLKTAGMIFSSISVLGLALALIGVYSMVGYTVSQQTREIGIRMAMGANAADVQRMILKRSARPVCIGLAVGMTLGFMLSLLLSKILPSRSLFAIGSRSLTPPMIIAVLLLLASCAIIAAYIPTRRATQIDPWTTLRSQ